MNNAFPPNIDPNLYALIACLIGYALSEEFNRYELSSIGNWLELLGQYLLTTASQEQLIESRKVAPEDQKQNINFLIRAIKQMEQELKEIKKKLDN